jgi:phosphate transport system protein
MRNRFEMQLKKLHNDLVELVEFIEMTIAKTMEAFKTNNYVLAREVYENDDIADELESKIERRALRILLFQQPVARDLRTISTALMITTDMERICDQAKNIAATMLRFEGQELMEKPEQVLKMGEICTVMVNNSIKAFINSDLELANSVKNMDDEVDALFWVIHGNVASVVTQNPTYVMQAIDSVMMSKYLEKIADHAVNIAGWVVFNITGSHKDKVLL